MGIKIAAAIMLTGTGTSVAAALVALQEVVTGPVVLTEDALLPVGVAVVILGATVAATIRVVRWIDRINREVQELRDILSVKAGEDEEPDG